MIIERLVFRCQSCDGLIINDEIISYNGFGAGKSSISFWSDLCSSGSHSHYGEGIIVSCPKCRTIIFDRHQLEVVGNIDNPRRHLEDTSDNLYRQLYHEDKLLRFEPPRLEALEQYVSMGQGNLEKTVSARLYLYLEWNIKRRFKQLPYSPIELSNLHALLADIDHAPHGLGTLLVVELNRNLGNFTKARLLATELKDSHANGFIRVFAERSLYEIERSNPYLEMF